MHFFVLMYVSMKTIIMFTALFICCWIIMILLEKTRLFDISEFREIMIANYISWIMIFIAGFLFTLDLSHENTNTYIRITFMTWDLILVFSGLFFSFYFTLIWLSNHLKKSFVKNIANIAMSNYLMILIFNLIFISIS